MGALKRLSASGKEKDASRARRPGQTKTDYPPLQSAHPPKSKPNLGSARGITAKEEKTNEKRSSRAAHKANPNPPNKALEPKLAKDTTGVRHKMPGRGIAPRGDEVQRPQNETLTPSR